MARRHRSRRAYAVVGALAVAVALTLVAPTAAAGLPPSTENVDLVGKLRVHDAAENHVRAVSTLGSYAYLAAAEEPAPPCSLPGGIYVVDISDPQSPREVGFIPTTPGWIAYHGVRVLHVDTPSFAGDVLVHANEVCTNAPGPGGISLWDVTNPLNPTSLAVGAGDTDPLPGVPARAHRSRYADAWDAGDRAFVIMSDFEEPGVGDVDILEITDPRNPRRIAETGLARWPGAQNAQSAGMGNSAGSSTTGVRVRNVGGRWLALVAYQDAGQVVLDVSDPANPVFLEDSDYADPDPVTRLRPEGNATRGDWDRHGRFILAADNDTFAFRLLARITSGAFNGDEFRALSGSGTPPIVPGNPLSGPTYFRGLACSAIPAAPSPDAIALIERGTCTFQVKFNNARAAGYQAVIVFNAAAAGQCDTLPGLAGVTGDRPFLLVPRSAGYKILGVAGYEPARCTTGPNPPVPPSGTPGSNVSVTSVFDGWGYARLLDAGSLAEADAYAPMPLLDERYARGFGTLSINEIVADPTHDLAYSSWYEAGFRVLAFSGGRLREAGHFTADTGADFLGVDVHVKPDGRRYVLASERDTGLYVFRYGTDLGVRSRARPSGRRGQATWVATVSNDGTISATETVLRMTLPARLEMLSVRPSQGRCSVSGRALVCRLGTVVEDATAQVRIVTRASRSGRVRATANVASPEVDYDPRNNRADASARVTVVRGGAAGTPLSGRGR